MARLTQKRTIVGATAVVVAVGVLALAALTIFLYRSRSIALAGYDATASHQRRAIGATRPPARDPNAETAAGTRTTCVRGVDTLVTALLSADDALPTGGPARVAALVTLSARAVRAERFVEWAKPAPTLPKRLGSVASAEAGAREPIEPVLSACDGTAYAAFVEPMAPAAGAQGATAPESTRKAPK